MATRLLKINNARLAVLLMVLSSTIVSTSGLVMRNLESANDWQIVFWRGLSLAAGILAFLFFEHRAATFREIRNIGLQGVLGSVFLGGALTGYVLAIANTTVANAVFTMGAIPFITAILSWIVLGERVNILIGTSISLAIGGVALMVGDGISAGTAFGNSAALLAAFSASAFVVVLRKGRGVNMLPTSAGGALVSASIASVMTTGVFYIELSDLLLCLILGGIIASSGQVLFVRASRYLSGAELTLLTLVEFILGPLWVWAFLNEIPSKLTLVGGAMVFIAVGGHAVYLFLGNRNDAV